jgi:hypothetical protein
LDDRISSVFEARLRKLKPDSVLRAVVMLRREPPSPRAVRATQIKNVRKAARTALAEVDVILERFGGTRLAKEPNSLGYVTVETTPAGIRALAASDSVKGVLEDQPVRLAM